MQVVMKKHTCIWDGVGQNCGNFADVLYERPQRLADYCHLICFHLMYVSSASPHDVTPHVTSLVVAEEPCSNQQLSSGSGNINMQSKMGRAQTSARFSGSQLGRSDIVVDVTSKVTPLPVAQPSCSTQQLPSRNMQSKAGQAQTSARFGGKSVRRVTNCAYLTQSLALMNRQVQLKRKKLQFEAKKLELLEQIAGELSSMRHVVESVVDVTPLSVACDVAPED